MYEYVKTKNGKTYFINTKDRYKINDYYKQFVDERKNEKLDIKKIARNLSEEYACYEILKYIKNEIWANEKTIKWGSKLTHITVLPRGHLQLTNDVFFDNCYYHQYVIAKALKIDMEVVKKYIIHHVDRNKANNSFFNLFIFFNRNVHLSFHKALEKNKDIDIIEFNANYMKKMLENKDLSEEEKKEINEYRELLDKLIAKQFYDKNTFQGFNELDYEISKSIRESYARF